MAFSMVSVAGGAYLQGANRTGGRRSRLATVSDFLTADQCVTTSEWAATVSAAPGGYTIQASAVPSRGWSSLPPATSRRLPAVGVSLFDAAAWCNARSELDGLTPACLAAGSVYRGGGPARLVFDLTRNGYRPPTEAEWEFAARERGVRPGDEASGAHDGSTETDVANFGRLYPVASDDGPASQWQWGARGAPRVLQTDALTPNALGLYHCSGNIWEWTCTSWDGEADYDQTERVALMDRQVVIRGGSVFDALTPNERRSCHVEFRLEDLGLRLARSAGA